MVSLQRLKYNTFFKVQKVTDSFLTLVLKQIPILIIFHQFLLPFFEPQIQARQIALKHSLR